MDIRKHSQTSNIIRLILSSSVTGLPLTGLTFESAGLIISTIADNEATATAYTVTAGNVETIATLGTFAAPTASKCRFKEVDSTNHPGLYEIQIANARFAVASAKKVVISVLGASNLKQENYEICLSSYDPFDAVRMGMTALPSAAAEAAGGLLTRGTGAGQLLATDGIISANLTQILGTTITETAGQIAAAFKKFFNIATPTSTMNKITLVDTVTTATTATNLTNAPSNGDFTATMKASITAAVPAIADIVDAVFDEEPTGHIDGDKAGKQIWTVMNSLATAGAGSGAISWDYTLTDATTTNPIINAEVWVTTDSAGANIIASGYTNTLGVVSFMLDAGTAYIWRRHPAYNFTNPDVEVIA
jgi:hypothetical protein